MGVPFMIEKRNLTTPNGEETCFEINFPSRCEITRIVIVQIAGTLSNFSAAVFNSAEACGGESISEAEVPGGKLPPELFRQTPNLQGVGGSLAWFANDTSGGKGYTFVGAPNDLLGRGRRMYLKIRPDGGGDKEFAVSISGNSFDGG